MQCNPVLTDPQTVHVSSQHPASQEHRTPGTGVAGNWEETKLRTVWGSPQTGLGNTTLVHCRKVGQLPGIRLELPRLLGTRSVELRVHLQSIEGKNDLAACNCWANVKILSGRLCFRFRNVPFVGATKFQKTSVKQCGFSKSFQIPSCSTEHGELTA